MLSKSQKSLIYVFNSTPQLVQLTNDNIVCVGDNNHTKYQMVF